MENINIDYEKYYLIIYRNADGCFCNHRWFNTNMTPEKMYKSIERYNENQKEKEKPQIAEIITDKLIREICAYKEKSVPLEDILSEVKELQGNISDMRENLNSALELLDGTGKES